ncbi:MAG: 2-amino-4-hydroxy-6-hydroxymethyldihydropteridine diphosphokinase [Rhodoglobus sp.]
MIRQQRMQVDLPAVIAIGSNLGDREAIIRDAVRAIDALPGVVVVRASGLVETAALKPEGVDEHAPAYLNAVVAVRSAIGALQLLDALRGIETEFGRVRDVRWGDRTLDLDIVQFAGPPIDEPDLTVPHPRAWQRAFVLAPWLQIEPDATLPGHGRIADLLADAVRRDGTEPTPYAAEPLS